MAAVGTTSLGMLANGGEYTRTANEIVMKSEGGKEQTCPCDEKVRYRL